MGSLYIANIYIVQMHESIGIWGGLVYYRSPEGSPLTGLGDAATGAPTEIFKRVFIICTVNTEYSLESEALKGY